MIRNIQGEKGCFAAGTIVCVPKGTKSIERFEVGDDVVSFSDRGLLDVGKVIGVHVHDKQQCHTYYFWGKKLVCTPNHWVLNQFNAFVEVGTLEVGKDAIVDDNGHLRPLTSSIKNSKLEKVYSLEIALWHTFIANDVRVHNGGLGLGKVQEFIEGEKGGGKGGGGGAARPAVEDPNTLQSKAIARAVDLIAEGPIVGLVDGKKSIYFDGTAVEADDGTFNFEGVTYDTRIGTPDQDPLPGFPSIETEISVGVEIKADVPVIRTITNSEVEAIRVTLQIPQLSESNKTTGDLHGHRVQIVIAVRNDEGNWIEQINDLIDGKTMTPYERQYRIELDVGQNPWDIRFSRVSPDSDDAAIQNKTYWLRYTEIIDEKLIYPDSALVGLEVDSQLFGGEIPRRAFHIKGRIISIPSNYDPDTRIYTGLWDGTFTTGYTNNPAWVFYDILTNSRFGLGSAISAATVDKFALFSIGQYCDELVEDGFGGQEPRFTFNGIINTREDAYSVLSTFVSVFRGMTYWSSGAVGVVSDRPTTASVLVGPANVINGDFNYENAGEQSRHNSILVTWNDPDDGYRPAIEVVEDNQDISDRGLNQSETVAFACTSRGQANRFGKWLLDIQENETEIVRWKASFDQLDVLPGEVVKIADPNYAGADIGGRIVSTTASSITLDRSFTFMSDGLPYTISVVLPDGTIEDHIALEGVGDHTTLTFDGTFATQPVKGAMWVIGGTDVAPREFRVISITEREPNIFEIMASEHDLNKYVRIDTDIDLDTITRSRLAIGEVEVPDPLVVVESLYKINNQIKTRITLSWKPPNDARVISYDLRYRRLATSTQSDPMLWVMVTSTADITQDILDFENGEYDFEVRSVANVGRSPWKTVTETILGKSAPPADVSTFTSVRQVTGVQLSWFRNVDIDLIGYTIKEGTDWDNPIQIIVRSFVGTTLFVGIEDSLDHHYMIRAIDSSDIESANVVHLVTSVIAPGDIAFFEALPAEDFVMFKWISLEELGIEYIIRRGADWNNGEFVAQSSGDNVTTLIPSVGDQIFWIKALSKAGLYSSIERFTILGMVINQNRNVIITIDNKAAGYTGVTHNLTVNGSDQLQIVDAVLLGEHYFPSNFSILYRSRNWLDTILTKSGGTTWANATWAWEDSESDAPWTIPIDDPDTFITKKICVFEGPQSADERFGFNFDENTLDFNGVITPNVESGVAYVDARIGQGLFVSDVTKVKWTTLSTVPSEFSVQFRFKVPAETMNVYNYVMLWRPTGSHSILIGYDGGAQEFFAIDETGLKITNSIVLVTDSFVTVILTQGAANWGLYVNVEDTLNTHTSVLVTEAHSPIGVWTELSLYEAH